MLDRRTAAIEVATALCSDALFQPLKLVGMIGCTIRRDDFHVPATVRYQFSGFFHRSGNGIPLQSHASRRIVRINEKLHEATPGQLAAQSDPLDGFVKSAGRSRPWAFWRICNENMVPVERIELPTFGLQNRCSTAELNRRRY